VVDAQRGPMSKEVVRPVDEETAKAIQQTAILGQKLTDMASGGGRWLAEILGRLPHNIVGIADDRVAIYRARRWIEMNEDLENDLLQRGVKDRIEPSFTVLIPLLEAAVDENRAELKKMWRRLLANAYDPSRSGRVRLSFVKIAQQLDPTDALVLEAIGSSVGNLQPNARDYVHARARLPLNEVMVSFDNLRTLGLLFAQAETFNPHITDKGVLFLQAVRE
jgi:abortive infection alpha-like protein